ncbi:DUF928 domain-containing protein [Nostoc punctiforme]|uniref:DUF928 domain-containing protein n=1 Tax=Nostoc punctiforme (strain ATCC 29133 / PCC 73102) TaxID=63737 RepID=B2IYS1_NOSP7|nr:DUF928 domain-containing protein [Nostoc punctiforme]ACC81654.1 protein of unknown function DUF928 [Nostoc punctiforme PCC 73102]
MTEKRLLLKSIGLRYIVPLAIASLTIFSLPIQAQVIQPKLPDNGAPIGRRRGGTSRNDCPAVNIPVTALVPGKEASGDSQDSASFLASTISEHPTFWVYTPELPNNARSGEFILQNEVGEDIYQKSLTLPQTASFIAISLPSSPKYSLQIGKKYHWYFKIYCGKPEPETGYFYVDAWIERIALTNDLDLKLKMQKSLKYITYFEQNIWYNALTNLGEQIRSNSQNNNFKTDWVNFLKSIDLQDISQEPVVIIDKL